MKYAKVRKKVEVTERIGIIQCNPGDDVYVNHPSKTSSRGIGRVVIVKVKNIGKGKLQIKYRSRWQDDGVIQKIDVPSTLIVERVKVVDPAGDVPVEKCVGEVISSSHGFYQFYTT